MTAGVQCDTCRTFTPQPSSSWLFLVRPEAQPSIMSVLTGSSQSEGPLAFCGWKCLADHAIVEALAEGKAEGVELPPREGTGWPS